MTGARLRDPPRRRDTYVLLLEALGDFPPGQSRSWIVQREKQTPTLAFPAEGTRVHDLSSISQSGGEPCIYSEKSIVAAIHENSRVNGFGETKGRKLKIHREKGSVFTAVAYTGTGAAEAWEADFLKFSAIRRSGNS
ncbi:hypothetical protein L218DRAFT_949533 [Marasmius fiardii PR-910]|nr:hypothetical protein L218DRAFT_949533 [Marasmius fiardii PR-910]